MLFSPNAPLPSGLTNGVVAVTPTSGTSAQFDIGTFTFDKPGEYHYELREVIPDAANKVLGVSYDATIYRISMVIADDGEGSLKLARLVIDKSSTSATGWDTLYSGVTPPAENSKYPQFTNTYSTQTETIILRGIKVLENKNLSDYGAGAFRFNIVAGGSRPIGSSDAFVADSNQPMPNSATASTAPTGDVVFGGLVFDGSNPVVGKEFKDIITEVQPTENGLYSGTPIAGATKDLNGNWVSEGITYDKSEKEIFIQVTSTDNGAGEVIVPQVVGNQFVFTNSYHTNTVTYNIAGEKVMDGRDFQEGDSFTFEIEAVGGAPAPVNGQNQPVTSVTIQPTAGKNEQFSFGTISFNQDNMRDGLTAGGSAKTKTFTYILREVKGNAAGITYDMAERTLTLELKDNLGSLEIVSAKLNGETLQDGEISWTNIYRAAVAYSGVEIVKTLEGKALTKGEFSFKLTPEAGTPDLPATEKSFAISENAYYNPESNSSTKKMQKLTGLVFTQADVGKTFSYVLKEKNAGKKVDRVTYDDAQYLITVKVEDDGVGGLRIAEQKVTKLGSEEEVSKIVFQNTYTADPLSPPKTGDETPLFLWTALLFVSGIGFATTVVSFERKKKEQTK